MKKTKQLLSELPQPNRDLALGYFDEEFFEKHKGDSVSTITGALCCSFRWEDTKEGYDYWWDLCKTLGL